MKYGDLPKTSLHTAGQKLINIYPLPGVGQLSYTAQGSPKPLFLGDTGIGIKQIPPFFITAFARCHVLDGNGDQLLASCPASVVPTLNRSTRRIRRFATCTPQ